MRRQSITMLRRRDFLALGGAAATAALLPGQAFADIATGVKLHGLSAFGDLKYKADFAHFDYVNVEAPTGGIFNFSPPNWGYNQDTQTFNTLNSFADKGDAPPRMRNGRIVEAGPSQQIFENPQTDYTRALISAAFKIETAPVGIVSE